MQIEVKEEVICGRSADTGTHHANWLGILGLKDAVERSGNGRI
jgi:hypothetical protein